MKMAKASDSDIEAAGELMGILDDIGRGYYPASQGEEQENLPTFFDEDDPKHLRALYDRINNTLDKSPGYPGRVIGGMCYVILYPKNAIVDPDADELELHPRLKQALNRTETMARTLEAVKAALLTFGSQRNGPVRDALLQQIDAALTDAA